MTEDSPSADGAREETSGESDERSEGDVTGSDDGVATDSGAEASEGDPAREMDERGGPPERDADERAGATDRTGDADERAGATDRNDDADERAGATDRNDDAAEAVASSRQPTGDAAEAADPSGDGQSGAPAHERGAAAADVPEDVAKYQKFTKIDGGTYDRANDFLRERTYITAREWAIARLCADFRTETGVEMTKIGENLPHLVPFMTDTYSPQAVNQARASFEEKVRKAGATFLYGAMCDFFTAEELDDVMYEATEVAKFLLEVEGVDLAVEDELEAEDRISEVMRDVREQSLALRHDEVSCPECGHEFQASED